MHFDALDKNVEDYCENNHIMGMLRITVKEKTVYEKNIGYADLSNKTKFTEESMFSLYSLSKPFCTIGLLKLCDKGLIDLDVHPSNYVPEAEGFDKRVTVRHLLHHVSGLPDFSQTQGFSQKHEHGYAEDARKHLKELTEYPSFFAPGTSGKYANINFILCALIIENVSNMTYAEYMKKEVFEPLGMYSAMIDNNNMTVPNRVKGYDLIENKMLETDKCHDWLFGAGDMVATVDDVYCLNKAIKNKLLLREETWRQALTPSPLNSMGMGCTITDWYGKMRITHNGGSAGFRTLHIQLLGDDFDVIFLSNSGFGNARHELAEIIHSHFYKKNGNQATQIIKMDEGYI